VNPRDQAKALVLLCRWRKLFDECTISVLDLEAAARSAEQLVDLADDTDRFLDDATESTGKVAES